MDLNEYIKREWNIGYLDLRIIPNAKKTMIWWLMGDWKLKIRISTIPEDWKANKELILFLSKQLKLKKNQLQIVSWFTFQNKLVKIDF